MSRQLTGDMICVRVCLCMRVCIDAADDGDGGALDDGCRREGDDADVAGGVGFRAHLREGTPGGS